MDKRPIKPIPKEFFYGQLSYANTNKNENPKPETEIFDPALIARNISLRGNGNDVMVVRHIVEQYSEYLEKNLEEAESSTYFPVNNVWYERLQNFFDAKKNQVRTKYNITFNRRLKTHLINKKILLDILEENKHHYLSLEKIRALYVARDRTTTFSLPTLSKVLKNDLGYSYKTCFLSKNNKDSALQDKIRSVFLRKFMEIYLKGHEVIYLDESGFTNPRNKMKKWTSPYKINPLGPRKRVKRINLVAAIGLSGVIHKNVSVFNTNSMKISNFIKGLEKAVRRDVNLEKKYEAGQVFIYLDNAKFHRSVIVRDTIRETRFNIIYGIPYTPQYDAVEYLFSLLKDMYRSRIFLT